MRIWGAQTGDEIRQLIGPLKLVNGVEFSPDGRYVVTAGDDGVRLWNAQTGEKIRQFGKLSRAYSSLLRATFSPDGKYVLSAANGTNDERARMWNASTGRLIREYQSAAGPMSCVDVSPHGRYIITDGIDNTAC